MSSSSLVDLKAELARKQEQFRKEKAQNASGNVIRPKPLPKKASVWSKKNDGVEERAQKDSEQIQEEVDALATSRQRLQEKAKLYEKLTGTLPEEQTKKLLLVDFEKKTIDSVFAQRDAERRESEKKDEEDVTRRLKENVPEPEDDCEKWVDYVDSLGRSRRCLKKDLPHLQQLDAELQGKRGQKTQKDVVDGKELMSADMIREEQRMKWEREAEQEVHGPMHYANVRHNEIRTHGVGFYEFDKDVEKRQEQMESLKQLRSQTLDQQEKRERLKAKRQAILQERLAKVRQRKLVKEGGLTEDEAFDIIQPKTVKKVEPAAELLTRDETLRNDLPTREWDKGKLEFDLDRDYVQKRRDERETEFAPPQFYYDIPKSKMSSVTQNMSHDCSATDKTAVNDLMGSITGNIHAIRTQVERETSDSSVLDKPESDSRPDVSNIPLPNKTEQSREDLMPPPTISAGESYQPPSQYFDSGIVPGPYHYPGYPGAPVGGIHIPPPPIGCPVYPPMAGMFNPSVTAFIEPSQPWPATGYAPMPQSAMSVDQQNTHVPPAQDVDQQNIPASVTQPRQTTPPPGEENTTEALNLHCVAEKVTPSTLDASDNAALPKSIAPEEVAMSVSSATVQPGPQPAHYASGPTKPQAKKPKYTHVPIHLLPPSLPAPPTLGLSVQYPSQEEVFGSTKSKTTQMSEEDAVKKWQRQFHFQPSGATASQENSSAKTASKGTSSLKPANIPFASPYIQNPEGGKETEDLEFDPSRPPPNNS